jgi:AraC-like DNA-binding protein
VFDDEIDTIQNRVCLPYSELSFVRYGASIQVTGARVPDSYLLICGQSGRALLHTRGSEVTIARGCAAIVPPNESFSIDGGTDASVLVWKVRQHVLERQAAMMFGYEPSPVIHFAPGLSLESGSGASFARALLFMTNELDAPESIFGNASALNLMEQSLMCALLEAQPSDLECLTAGDYRKIAPACVRKVEEYIKDHIGEDVTMEDLVRASGVSGRTLFRVFRLFRRASPMAYLRIVRMQHVRNNLLRPSMQDLTVTAVLSRWGIKQFGRFAAEYRQKYGELPSQTLKSTMTN